MKIPATTRPLIDWAEYDHFRGFGWDHDRIAARLGVRPNSLRTALDRQRVRAGQVRDAGKGVAA